MKFIHLTTEDGQAISVSSEAIGVLAPSLHKNATTAVYDFVTAYVEDRECIDENNLECAQENALHVRESRKYIEEAAEAKYNNEKREYHSVH